MTKEVIDLKYWSLKLHDLSEAYRSNKPFPYIVLDNFLTEEVALQAEKAFPGPDEKIWTNYIHYNSRKRGLPKIDLIPPSLKEIILTLNGNGFLDFLQQLTGIKHLLADETIDGGGLHQTQRGGYLKIHSDFTSHPQFHFWRRRVNVIIYLNRDWKEPYGGHLELWSQDMHQCEARILPVFNRCVIFNTSERSYHGHPEPLQCPVGMTRKSVALYYFTKEAKKPVHHPTDYQARPEDKKLPTAIDNSLLRLYKKTIRLFGWSDDFASRIIGVFSRKKN